MSCPTLCVDGREMKVQEGEGPGRSLRAGREAAEQDGEEGVGRLLGLVSVRRTCRHSLAEPFH